MVTFPFCKVNLGLHILSKRDDGFHNIETCFYPVPWTDVLEIIPATSFDFSLTGIAVAGSHEANSCVAAWKALKRDHNIPPVKMRLHKIIPTGAGLGGGSADGAFALRSLDKIFEIGLSPQQLAAYAASMGSDCAFFLEERPMIGTGRGEVLHPAKVSLKEKFLTIVKPDVHVPTAEAYRNVRPKAPAISLSEVLQLPVDRWKDVMVNDFEESVFKKYPEISALKEKMYALGASYAAMSGSGASVFGIFDHEVFLDAEFPTATVWSGALSC